MKIVGYLIKEPGRDPRYPRYELDRQDIADGDREFGFTSEPVYTLTGVDRYLLTKRPDFFFAGMCVALIILVFVS